MKMVELGARVRAALEEIGLSQVAFARLIGSSNGYVSEICRGLKKPSYEVLLGFAERGVSISWLLTGQGGLRLPAAPMLVAEPPPSRKADPRALLPPTMDSELRAAIERLMAQDARGRLQPRVAAYIEGLLDSQSSGERAAG